MQVLSLHYFFFNVNILRFLSVPFRKRQPGPVNEPLDTLVNNFDAVKFDPPNIMHNAFQVL